MAHVFTYPDLPILARKEDILKALKDHQALVVQGGTGSGKTTQLPKFLLEAGYAEGGLIGVTQPRRIAALAIADRLRQETVPSLIGAKIRFHEDLPAGAEVKVMTDGILLQEFRRDALLRAYSCIILDEAHERSLNVDILLGIFRSVLARRPEFRLVVTSATLDADRFSLFLGGGSAAGKTVAEPAAGKPAGQGNAPVTPDPNVPVIEVEGRQYPVKLEYWDISGKDAIDEEDEDGTPARAFPPVEAAAIAIRELQARRPDNLLAFLPSEKEIHELHRELERDLGKNFAILPLYSRLGPADQKKVFQESHQPKIILATNIAETSLTIPGIGYVVDTGLARISRYHPQTKIQGLPIERISQASARQRAGRAGRVKPGVCVRLYGEDDFNERPAFTEPEILRSNLANVVLQLLALGLDVETFPFPDPPAPAALKGAFRQLHELGAVDGQGTDARMTQEGRKLSRIPVDVAIGKILLKATELATLHPAIVIAAGITVQDPRFFPHDEPERGKAVGLHRRFDDPNSDFMSILALWIWIQKHWSDGLSQRKLRALCLENFISYNRVREWMDLSEQFCRLLHVTLDLSTLKPSDINPDALHKSILAGFLPFLARRKPEDVTYRIAGDKEAHLHPGSALSKRKPEWIVAGEIRQTSRVFIFRACEIKPAWVEELAPDACRRTYMNVAWNPERGFVEALERVTYKGFAIRQDRRVNYESVEPEECAEIFWREGAIRAGSGAPYPFREKNERTLETLAALERKARVHGLVPDEDALNHWYRQRAPQVTSRVRLERFLKESGEKVLTFSIKEWTGALDAGSWDAWLPDRSAPGLAVGRTAEDGPQNFAPAPHPVERLFPDALIAGDHTYPVSYRFDYGDPVDGISLETDPEGLAALSMEALARGIPGWKRAVWMYFLERLGTKAGKTVWEKLPEVSKAWDAALTQGDGVVGKVDDVELEKSPAMAMVRILSAAVTAPGNALAFPATWPAHLQIHLFVTSPTGRKFLIHVDPSFGPAEFFYAARKVLFGENWAQPWEAWAPIAAQNHGKVPPPLPWRGMAFGVDPIPASNESAAAPPKSANAQGVKPMAASLRPSNAGATSVNQSAACRFFASLEEAAFFRQSALLRATPFSAAETKAAEALAAFFSKRWNVLIDAWSCPERMRRETSRLREHLSYYALPRLFLDAYGPGEALARAEKELPPPRAIAKPPHAGPGTQLKSLAALGQAVARGNESVGWAGVALCLGAAMVSRRCLDRWFRFFAQPPLQAKAGLEKLFAEVTEAPAWEDLLLTPYYAAWAAGALENRLPEIEALSGNSKEELHADRFGFENEFRESGDWSALKKKWAAQRDRLEAQKKSGKLIRDRYYARCAVLGLAVGGLPMASREALETLDKSAPLQRAAAELELTLHLNKASAKSGSAAAAAIAKSDPALEEKKENLLKGLSGRFKKL